MDQNFWGCFCCWVSLKLLHLILTSFLTRLSLNKMVNPLICACLAPVATVKSLTQLLKRKRNIRYWLPLDTCYPRGAIIFRPALCFLKAFIPSLFSALIAYAQFFTNHTTWNTHSINLHPNVFSSTNCFYDGNSPQLLLKQVASALVTYPIVLHKLSTVWKHHEFPFLGLCFPLASFSAFWWAPYPCFWAF
jgi:hypothetical protein